MAEISAIILTYNSISFIRPCLNSVYTQDYPEFEVIVIDNNSKDGTVELIKKDYPQVILIENRQNLGACKARNQGIDKSKGEWILTLDCDVILEKDFLNKIVRFIEESKSSTGMFQPKILNMDRKTIYSYGIYLSKLRRFYDIGKGKLDNGKLNGPEYVFGACSAAALYKRQMLEEVKEDTGYFDERLFFLLEDADLSWRAKEKGWKAYFCPDAICYHSGNSSNTPRGLRQYLCWRNRNLILEKHSLNKIESSMVAFVYDLPRLLFLLFANSYVRSYIKNKDFDLNRTLA